MRVRIDILLKCLILSKIFVYPMQVTMLKKALGTSFVVHVILRGGKT